jgi:hypothetical protein
VLRASVALIVAFSIVFVPASPSSAEGEVSIRKFVNGERATSAPGPSVESGSRVHFRYVITVASSESLYDFIVTDTGGPTPDCDITGDGEPDGYNGHPGPLSNGSQFVCTASEIAGEPGITRASIGRVKAYNFDVTQSFEAADVGHYTVAQTTTSSAAASSSTASSTTASTASSTTESSRTTDPATTQASRSSQTPSAQTQPEETTSSTAGSTAAPSASPDSTTLGGDTAPADSGSGATSPSSAAATSQSLDRQTSSQPSSDTTDGSASDGAGGTRGVITSQEVPPDESATIDQPPASLAFGDESEFSVLWALASAAAGAGAALVGHRRRRQNGTRPRG